MFCSHMRQSVKGARLGLLRTEGALPMVALVTLNASSLAVAYNGGGGVGGYRSIYFPFQMWECVVRLAHSCSSLSCSCY